MARALPLFSATSRKADLAAAVPLPCTGFRLSCPRILGITPINILCQRAASNYVRRQVFEADSASKFPSINTSRGQKVLFVNRRTFRVLQIVFQNTQLCDF